jgi:hypothetical protein
MGGADVRVETPQGDAMVVQFIVMCPGPAPDKTFLLSDNHARAFAAGILAACDEIDARAKGP